MTPPPPSSHGYLVVRRRRNGASDGHLDEALAGLELEGWKTAAKTRDLQVLLGPTSRLQVSALGEAGVMIGDYYAQGRRAVPPPPASLETASCAARRLIRSGWGRYVMVWLNAAGELHILRDPSGALDAIHWTSNDAAFVAPEPPESLDDWLPPSTTIDWDRLIAFRQSPALACDALALSHIDPVLPGVLLTSGASGVSREVIWRPADHARPTEASSQPDTDGLRAVVETTIAALAGGQACLVGEISGGFDSAVVASSWTHSGSRAVQTWLNYHADSPESDERRYAQDLARQWSLSLTTRPKPVASLQPEQLAPLGESVRPSFHGLDPAYDADAAAHIRAVGATGLLTGQGGDAVFFQYPTPAIAADRVDRLGLAGLSIPFVVDTARWTRATVWSVAGVGLRHRLGRRQQKGLRLDPYASAPQRHGWLDGIDHLPPAKRGQIAQLMNCQIFQGDCLRARAADLIHPLLCQPVVEHCLSTPADVATIGGVDRGLARRAFRSRLPESISSRTGKGEMSTFYGQTVLASLPFLADLLRHGRLVDQGVLAPAELDALLDENTLIWSGDYNVVLIAAALEVWVRNWERRLAGRRHVPV